MKALKIILYIVIGLVIIVFGLSFIAKTKMHAERSIFIKAPKEVVFTDVKTFANSQKWSPWLEKDTNANTSITGTDGTVGAKYAWDGNKDMGQGEQTITKIDEGKSVESELHFIKPFDGHATSYIRLEDSTGGVKVVWGFNSEVSRPFNIIGLFMNMDKDIGDEYNHGLDKLKALAEKEVTSGTPKAFAINEVTVKPKTYIGIRRTVSFDKITPFYAENFPKIFADIKQAGLQPLEPVSGLYYAFDEKTMTTEVAAVAPVIGAKGKVGTCETFNLKGGKALEMDFYGDYKNLGSGHNQIKAFITEKKLKFIPPVLEEYITDPMTEKDPAKWLTKIYYFVE